MIARNSMCASPLPDFLMEFRRDDSEDAFDIHNTWNIALLLVTGSRTAATLLRLICQIPMAQDGEPHVF